MEGRRGRSGGRPPLPAGFGTIWTTVAVDLVGFGIVLPILPQYAERFGATPTTIGLLVASFSLAQLVFAPIMGRLSDRVGRKPVLLVSLFGTAIGSFLTGAAGSVAVLFVGRIVDGASGASVSVAQAAAADLAESPADRPRLMGLLGAAFGVGFVAGPAIGALGALRGPHVPFYVASALAFVNALVAIRRLPETAPAIVGIRTTAERAAAASSDARRIAHAPSPDGPGLVEPAHLPTIGTGDDDAEVADPDGIRRLIAAAFGAMVAFSGFEATFSLLGERRFGFDLTETAAVFTGIGLALVGVQVMVVPRVHDKLGERATLRCGFALVAAGLLTLAVDGGWATLVPALALLLLGQGLTTPTLSSAVANRAGDARGRWLGWQQSAGGLARVLGPALAGAMFEASIATPYLAGAALVLLAVLLVP